MHDIVFELKKETVHFERWKNSNGSFVACCYKAINLSEKYFEYRDRKTNGFTSICIYQTKFNEIEKTLEDFRCKIYLKTTRQKMEEKMIYGAMIDFNKNNE